jgi:hypothetical protein
MRESTIHEPILVDRARSCPASLFTENVRGTENCSHSAHILLTWSDQSIILIFNDSIEVFGGINNVLD